MNSITSQQSGALCFADNLHNFIEAAIRCPRQVVVLRSQQLPTREEVQRYVHALGGVDPVPVWGKVTPIKYEPSVKNSTALSLNELQLHTDGAFLESPPQRILLSFVRSDGGGGGASIFCSVTEILEAAPHWAIEALCMAQYLFVRTYDGDLTDSFTGPVLGRNASGNLSIRWRADHLFRPKVIDACGTKAEEAVEWLHNFLQKRQHMTYSAQSGETLLIPNTVFLHGRTPLSPDSTREVLRAWIV